MAKLKHVEKRFVLDVFDWDIDIVFTNNVPAYCKKHKLCDYENVDAFCDTQANENLTRLILPYSPAPYFVTHEAVHVIEEMFKAIGMKFEGEAAAYNVSYIVRIVLETASKKRYRKKK
jgi:hypothetical protein